MTARALYKQNCVAQLLQIDYNFQYVRMCVHTYVRSSFKYEICTYVFCTITIIMPQAYQDSR